ncbi:hypothetical protein MBLNU459_g5734t2 [Dothideomycetes sp. NU459]
MSDLNQVIIKHTQALRESSSNSSTSSLPMPRSNSVMTPSHVPILAPLRNKRIKLELALADVWTKDVIPYPGMGSRRAEHLIRDTANDLIRKLSMVSITSNFSKRSMSYASVGGAYPVATKPKSRSSQGLESTKTRRPPLVDFHNAPEAFLPEDFELQHPKRSKRVGFRALTMTCDRPRSPFTFHENKAPELKRAKSVVEQRAQGVEAPVGNCDDALNQQYRSDEAVLACSSFETPQAANMIGSVASPDPSTMRGKHRTKLFRLLNVRGRA